jgi:hypothetical protein
MPEARVKRRLEVGATLSRHERGGSAMCAVPWYKASSAQTWPILEEVSLTLKGKQWGILFNKNSHGQLVHFAHLLT